MINTKDIAWLAGLLEGEGTFMHKSGTPAMRLRMTDRDVIYRAATILDVPVSVTHPKGGYKPIWGCGTYGSHGIGWMQTILPFMGQRRQTKIREVLTHWKAQTYPQRAHKTPRRRFSDTKEIHLV